MDLGLQNKVAIVTAASRGLGRAVALAFAGEGARVVVNARDAERLAGVAAACEGLGAQALAVPGDVTNPTDVDRLVKTAVERFGTVDILVTNAGGPPAGDFKSLTLAQWEDACRLSLLSAVGLIQAVVPIMAAQKSGAIVSINSMTVKQPIPGLTLSLLMSFSTHARTVSNSMKH